MAVYLSKMAATMVGPTENTALIFFISRLHYNHFTRIYFYPKNEQLKCCVFKCRPTQYIYIFP